MGVQPWPRKRQYNAPRKCDISGLLCHQSNDQRLRKAFHVINLTGFDHVESSEAASKDLISCSKKILHDIADRGSTRLGPGKRRPTSSVAMGTAATTAWMGTLVAMARHENQDISAMNELLTLAADFHAESACKLVSISTCRCCRVANSQRDVTQLIGATNRTNRCPSVRKTIAEF